MVLTHSLFAIRYQEASPRQIGEGLQGAIFEQVAKTWVIKKESPQNESSTSTSLAIRAGRRLLRAVWSLAMPSFRAFSPSALDDLAECHTAVEKSGSNSHT